MLFISGSSITSWAISSRKLSARCWAPCCRALLHFSQPLTISRSASVSRREFASIAVSGAVPSRAGALPIFSETSIARLADEGRPVVLHCGTSWSARSRDVAARLAEWAHASDDAGVVCATVDLETAPGFIRQRHIRAVPTVLLLCGGRIEQRADGADVSALEGLLDVASTYGTIFAAASKQESPTAEVMAAWPHQRTLAAADDLARRGVSPAAMAPLYEHVLQGGDAPLSFRARLGLLRCALETTQASKEHLTLAELAQELSAAIASLRENHADELHVVSDEGSEDTAQILRMLTHADLLQETWAGNSSGSKAEVLRLYAKGKVDLAIAAALRWYQQAAGSDVQGLVAAYALPERFSGLHGPLATTIEDAHGPAEPRDMLRRLFGTLEPTNLLVQEALADLEFLLDKKKWVPWFTRRIFIRKGGKPNYGRGTNRRPGYSKRYWIAWGRGTFYPNTKKMNSPHCDAGD